VATKTGKTERRSALLRRLWAVAFVAMGGLMAFGLLRYPFAPIRARDGVFVDKLGGKHSQSEYRAFKTWETILFATAGLTIGSAVAAAAAKRFGTR